MHDARRHLGIRLLAVLLLTATVAPTEAAHAEGDAPTATSSQAPAPNALPRDEAHRRLRLLRTRSNRWHAHRRQLRKTCHHCDGRKHVRTPWANTANLGQHEEGPRGHWVPCPTCKATGIYVSREAFMQAYFAFKSPAYRSQASSLRETEALYEELRAVAPELPRPSHLRYLEGRLVDTTHAVVLHRVGKYDALMETYWVWRKQADKKATWYLYDAEVDGPFPSLDEAETGLAARAATPQDPIVPVHDEPAQDEPAQDDPAHDEPVHDEPAQDEPAQDEPVQDEPARDEPGHDEPAPRDPVQATRHGEHPAASEPAVPHAATPLSEEAPAARVPEPARAAPTPRAAQPRDRTPAAPMPGPSVADAPWVLTDGGRTVRFASPARTRTTAQGAEVHFEGTVEGLEPGDILYVGDVRILVDREAGTFSQTVRFPAGGTHEIRITVEHRGDEVAGRTLVLRFE